MMDRPQLVSPELEIDLENLEKLNRYFGSYALVRHFLRRWLHPGHSFTAIDLCTGLGDIPRFIVNWCRKNHVAVQITAVDFQRATLELAMERSKTYPRSPFWNPMSSSSFRSVQPISFFVRWRSIILLMVRRSAFCGTRGSWHGVESW